MTMLSPMRRTTIFVSDMERSLALYRDVPGMTVFYDQEISSPEEGMMLGLPGAKVRVVSLQSGDSFVGMSFYDPNGLLMDITQLAPLSASR